MLDEIRKIPSLIIKKSLTRPDTSMQKLFLREYIGVGDGNGWGKNHDQLSGFTTVSSAYLSDKLRPHDRMFPSS